MFENKAEATGTHPTHSSRLFSHNGPWVCLSVGMVWIHFDISKSVTLIILETLKSRLGDKKEIKHFSEDFAPNCMIISKITKTVCTHTHTHTADIIDHYTERTSPRTNHLLPVEQQMESALNCFHFNVVEVPSRDPELEGWGRRTAWLGWGSDRRSGSVVGQRRTQMLSASVWRAVIVLHDCDLQSDNTVTPPSTSLPTGRYPTANRWWWWKTTFQATVLRFTVLKV